MNAIIISIGTELTTGELLDSNAPWISDQLTANGVRVLEHCTVGDEMDRIQSVIRKAMQMGEIIVMTGGLGPTPDDLTRDALAAVIAEPLVEDAQALAQLEEMFRRWQRPLHEDNRKQALIPRGCQAIPNERGTAPGIRYHGGEVRLFALPGVPDEMEAMFRGRVLPELKPLAVGQTIRQVSRLSYGISEAKIGALLGDLMKPGRNPAVGTAASHGIIGIAVRGSGSDACEVKRRVEADVAEIENRLTTAVFGKTGDTLESVTAALLRSHGLTISTAESCTGGLLAKRLTDVPGSSAYFVRGVVSYSNESKSALLGVDPDLIAKHGAVSEPVARAMASGCRTAAESDVALSITGIAGPTGGSPPDKPVGLVYIGLATAEEVFVKRILFGEHLDREQIRGRAASAALNLLRLQLLHDT